MADLTEIKASGSTKLCGGDELHHVDVELIGGKKRMLTDSIVTVEEIFGQDPFPDTWFRVDNSGVTDDTWRIQIAATTNDPTTPDRDVPAVDKTIVVTASEAGDEIALADLIVTQLNLDSNFNASLKAKRVPDLAIVHIFSQARGEFFERTGAGDFAVAVSGSASRTLGFDTLLMRGKATSLSRDPNFPHALGILGISGIVHVLPGAIGLRYEEFFKYSSSRNMLIDGTTPKTFTVPLSATEDIFVSQIRIFGGGNGIKFGQFLSKAGSGGLTNGIEIKIKSDNNILTREVVKTTEDFKNYMSFPNKDSFSIDVQAGSDQFMAIFIPEVPFPLRKIGTHGAGNDDYIEIKIQDNLTSGVSQLESMAIGFRQEI